jgi:Amiloride-sensitive sodium channel
MITSVSSYTSHMDFRFAKGKFQPHIKVELFTYLDFLSYLGGMMGLLAGISLLSIFEIIYHVARLLQAEPNRVQNSVITDATRVAWRNENHALYQFTKYSKEFLKKSSIHGVHYMTQDHGKCGRIVWMILVALSVLICSVFIKTFIEQAEKSPVAIAVDSNLRSLDDVRVSDNSEHCLI